MFVVNTTVVKALMTLRGLSRKGLAKLAGVREDNLRAWLAGGDSADLCMARKNQLVVLQALGIDDDTPRSDTVHAWVLDESSREARMAALEALSVMVSVYDGAEVIHFGADSDSAFTLSQPSHFGLRFAAFRVVLTVKPAFFRDVRFTPDDINGFSWAQENPVCLLPAFRFEQLANSDVTPAEFDDFAKGQVELAKWENLHLLAREHQIRPEDIARWMFTEVAQREERLRIAREGAEKHVLLQDHNLGAPVDLEMEPFAPMAPIPVAPVTAPPAAATPAPAPATTAAPVARAEEPAASGTPAEGLRKAEVNNIE